MVAFLALSSLAFRPELALLSPARSVAVRRAASIVLQQDASPLNGVLTGANKFSAAMQEGRDWKQGLAEALAGEYDREVIASQVAALKDSAPLVVFQWPTSPACKKGTRRSNLDSAAPDLLLMPFRAGQPCACCASLASSPSSWTSSSTPSATRGAPNWAE